MSTTNTEMTTQREATLGLRQAVDVARKYLELLYSTSEREGMRLEETERSADKSNWLITYSLLRDDSSTRTFLVGGIKTTTRDYKLITIDGRTGEVLSMKIRQL